LVRDARCAANGSEVDLAVGDSSRQPSAATSSSERGLKHAYFTTTLDAAALGAPPSMIFTAATRCTDTWAHVAPQHVDALRGLSRRNRGMPLMTPTLSNAAAAQWTRLWVDASFLMADAAMVMSMRGWRLMAGGRPAAREAERMFGEKVEAGFELAGALASGRVRTPEGAARKAIGTYGRRVRANRRRLG